MKNAVVYAATTEGIDDGALEKALSMLPLWRREYVEKKITPEKINGAFSYLLLQLLLEKEFAATDTAPFTYGKQGKPFFSKQDLFFSMSHCKTAVGAAVCEYEIGLDLMDSRKINENLAARICSIDELKSFELSEDKQLFLRQIWCKKESAVKMTGSGFTKGFRNVDTTKLHFSFFENADYIMSVYMNKTNCNVTTKEIDWKTLIYNDIL